MNIRLFSLFLGMSIVHSMFAAEYHGYDQSAQQVVPPEIAARSSCYGVIPPEQPPDDSGSDDGCRTCFLRLFGTRTNRRRASAIRVVSQCHRGSIQTMERRALSLPFAQCVQSHPSLQQQAVTHTAALLPKSSGVLARKKQEPWQGASQELMQWFLLQAYAPFFGDVQDRERDWRCGMCGEGALNKDLLRGTDPQCGHLMHRGCFENAYRYLQQAEQEALEAGRQPPEVRVPCVECGHGGCSGLEQMLRSGEGIMKGVAPDQSTPDGAAH